MDVDLGWDPGIKEDIRESRVNLNKVWILINKNISGETKMAA